MTLGSRSLISHHGWTLSQITYIGPTAELARKRLMCGTWESLLSKATWKARHMLAFHGLLDHPLRQLEVSLSAHRVSHRGVQTPAAAHCHQHRIHSLILLLSPVTSSEQRYCLHWRSLCAIVPSTVAMISQRHFEQCFLTVVLRRLPPVEQPISDMLWTGSIFPWAAGGYGTKYSMLFDIIRWVYEQDITKRANWLHHQILGRQYQQGGSTIPWVWVSRPCHSCRPFAPFQTMDQPTGSQTTTSGVYGWTKC